MLGVIGNMSLIWPPPVKAATAYVSLSFTDLAAATHRRVLVLSVNVAFVVVVVVVVVLALILILLSLAIALSKTFSSS